MTEQKKVKQEKQMKEKQENKYKELEVVTVRLVKEPSIISDTSITSASDASRVIQELISGYDREVFCVLNLTARGKPISMNVVSIGTITMSPVSTREVFKSSILANAAAVICFHCHPSGNPLPSMDDAVATQRIREAGELLDIKLVDHIVVACGTDWTFSFKGNGFLDDGNVVDKFKSFNPSEKELER